MRRFSPVRSVQSACGRPQGCNLLAVAPNDQLGEPLQDPQSEHGACSVAASYKPPMLVTRVRLPACALLTANLCPHVHRCVAANSLILVADVPAKRRGLFLLAVSPIIANSLLASVV